MLRFPDFEALTALGLMEFVTPDVIAENVVRERFSPPIGKTTLDSATNGDFAGRIQSGRLGAWIFRYEDKGERIKR
ncbi:MAG: hypothetical protein HN396_04340 [Gemmatimonadales bacterium]|nr:hypothetical protein [Gemmatimonadales bacterium]MDG2241828.1 hypothetical protein [Longimicrobiales bacterium]NCG32451.1 hypothetical protein [Pseudomonadota bacterium]MBT3497260.1 hypothetical protein [Gemmatimonadales bacterium]MBT3775308.1 hypothetical protein [Gemmatimonadales bacterium]